MDTAALLDLEQRLRQAANVAEVSHAIVNQTQNVLPYMQAVLLEPVSSSRLRAFAASNIPVIDRTSPYFAWIERLAAHLLHADQQAIAASGPNDVPSALAKDWNDMAPPNLLRVSLQCIGAKGPPAILMLFRQELWHKRDVKLAEHLAGSAGHALFARQRQQWQRYFWAKIFGRRTLWMVLAMLLAAMWLPVRLTALAPFEAVARDPFVVTAPIQGAVKQILVEPNAQVTAGMPLVQLEDSEFAAAYEVAARALLVAEAELKTAEQSGFADGNQKARLSQLGSAVRLREAEAASAKLRLEKTLIKAAKPGIAVFADAKAWQGRPVRTGERIMLLARGDEVELEIMLPVKDSIALENNAPVKAFFDNDPMHPVQGEIKRAGYAPVRTAEGQLAYRLAARLEPMEQVPRIGLRGTAKVYGRQVTLFFYLFRRPLTAFRQMTGW